MLDRLMTLMGSKDATESQMFFDTIADHLGTDVALCRSIAEALADPERVETATWIVRELLLMAPTSEALGFLAARAMLRSKRLEFKLRISGSFATALVSRIVRRKDDALLGYMVDAWRKDHHQQTAIDEMVSAITDQPPSVIRLYFESIPGRKLKAFSGRNYEALCDERRGLPDHAGQTLRLVVVRGSGQPPRSIRSLHDVYAIEVDLNKKGCPSSFVFYGIPRVPGRLVALSFAEAQYFRASFKLDDASVKLVSSRTQSPPDIEATNRKVHEEEMRISASAEALWRTISSI